MAPEPPSPESTGSDNTQKITRTQLPTAQDLQLELEKDMFITVPTDYQLPESEPVYADDGSHNTSQNGSHHGSYNEENHDQDYLTDEQVSANSNMDFADTNRRLRRILNALVNMTSIRKREAATAVHKDFNPADNSPSFYLSMNEIQQARLTAFLFYGLEATLTMLTTATEDTKEAKRTLLHLTTLYDVRTKSWNDHAVPAFHKVEQLQEALK
jgi:hypothetical protein